jgi:hypothetical protein
MPVIALIAVIGTRRGLRISDKPTSLGNHRTSSSLGTGV